MEWFSTGSEWIQTNYPILLTIVGTVIATAGTVYAVYTQFKNIITPIKDWIAKQKEKDIGSEVKTNLLEQMQMSNLATQIIDLEEKINNPLTSEQARVGYMSQLKILSELKIKLDAGLVKAEDITSKF